MSIPLATTLSCKSGQSYKSCLTKLPAATACLLLLCIPGYTQSPVLACKKPALAAHKSIPKLSYECDSQLNDWDEKVLKLPARLAAIKTLIIELSSFSDTAWWTADVVDLSVCDYTNAPGRLTAEQRRSFMNGEYVFWLFGDSHIRLGLIPDPCYQTEYGGANAFLLYRNGGRVYITQVLDGYSSRADNSVGLAFAKLNGQEIIEISSGSGGLTPSLTNYYFVIDPRTNKAVPKNLFKGERGPTNEISSAMLFNEVPATPLKIFRGNTLAQSFTIYLDDEHGKIDDNGRTLSRKIMRWNGTLYR